MESAHLHPGELTLLGSEKPPTSSVRFLCQRCRPCRADKELALVVPDLTVTVFCLLVGRPRPCPIVPSAWKTWVPLAWLARWAAWWRCSQTAPVSCSSSDPQRAPLVSVWPTAMAVGIQVCPWDPRQSAQGVARFLLGFG